jgi:hypothetical protein
VTKIKDLRNREVNRGLDRPRQQHQQHRSHGGDPDAVPVEDLEAAVLELADHPTRRERG